MPQPHQKRRPQNQRSSRPNKAQQREAQIRAEQMAADPSAEALGIEDAAPEAEPVLTPAPERPALAADASASPATATATRGASRRSEARGRTNRRATIAPATPAITREQEYRFIRADLRRLLITAGTVLVLMLALLFVVEG
jgi:hypothetical protein